MQHQRLTISEFSKQLPQLTNAHPNQRVELVNGNIATSQIDVEAQHIIDQAFYQIQRYVRAKKLGQLTTTTGYYRPRDAYNLRFPHIAFISYERTQPLHQKGIVPYMPDLVVLVKPATMDVMEIAERGIYFLKNGTALVWVLHPDTAGADVCTRSPKRSFRIYKVPKAGILGGSDVLPGFSLDLSQVFAKDIPQDTP